MNSEIRSAIIALYDTNSSFEEVAFRTMLKDRFSPLDIAREVGLMKDSEELVLDGVRWRLSKKFLDSQAPLSVRFKKYMVANHITYLQFALMLISVVCAIVNVYLTFKK